jgi:hypothetical protein
MRLVKISLRSKGVSSKVYAIKNSPYSHVADYFIPKPYFYIIYSLTAVDIKIARKVTVLKVI